MKRLLQTAYGWALNVAEDANPRSVQNFPLQGNGAEMLRLACCLLTERGMRVCAPVHDALLVESPVEVIEQTVETCQREMEKASELVLPGFPLRTDCKVVRYPDHYADVRNNALLDVLNRLRPTSMSL
jgi:DNA polymerase I